MNGARPRPLHCVVTQFGSAARRHLAAARRGEAIAVFRRSFYLETGNPETGNAALVCFGPTALGPGPLNALCDPTGAPDWEAAGLRPGVVGRIAGMRLTLGDAVLSFASAKLWRPAAPRGGWTRRTLALGLGRLAAERGRFGDVGWLPAALPLDAPAPDEADRLHRIARRAAAGPIEALARWLAEAVAAPGGAPPPAPAQAAGLIGLGAGLTPSGDDFVGGAMIALRALGRGDLADSLGARALAAAPARTNRISLAHLASAARGEGAAALHAAMAALCAGGSDLPRRLGELDAIGHTSGWDALAGAVLVIAAFRDAPRPAPPPRPPPPHRRSTAPP